MNSWKRLAAQLRSSERNARPQVLLQVTNKTRNAVLATCLTLADTPQARQKGLLGRDGLAPGEGLWIIPCQAIHMFFMRFSIDLVYIDRQKRVRKVKSSIAPWRISTCLTAHSVLELPAGIVRETGTRRGDSLEFTSNPSHASASDTQDEYARTSSPAQYQHKQQNERAIGLPLTNFALAKTANICGEIECMLIHVTQTCRGFLTRT